VITHDHPDHYDPELVTAIMDKNPDAMIVAHASITDSIEVFQSLTVEPGDSLSLGLFELEFFGGEHAAISEGVTLPANLGVMIDDLLYYPGDSFATPGDRAVDTLALPIAAPWLKVSETIEFLRAVHPRAAFPTHDAILSSSGHALLDRMLTATATQSGINYARISELTI
jgi:L-ascorbate metabolism protein UlaG (beta-lactamase superfamily)